MSIKQNRGQSNNLSQLTTNFRFKRVTLFGLIIVIALLAFELFNYSTTEFALRDLLGNLRFAGLAWSTILSIAFCGIDFAGIARLFTPEQGRTEPTEVWYLFGAWLLAATMNAILTWWGVSMAVANHQIQSTAVMDPNTVLKVVPVFVAVMVWLIRILIIGSLSYAGERLFWQGDQARSSNGFQPAIRSLAPLGVTNGVNNQSTFAASNSAQANFSAATPAAPTATPTLRPAPKPVSRPEMNFGRTEPTYHSVSMSGRSASSNPPTTFTRETNLPDTRR